MSKHILDIPCYSQHLDVSDESWRSRACGILCLKMVMDSYGKYNEDIMYLINRGVAKGGYSPSGWRHDVLVEIAKEAGFSAFRKEYRESEEGGLEDVLIFLKKGTGVMISAVKNFSEKDKFHMVLLTGFEREDNDVKGFYYHDPDSVDRDGGKHRFVPIETFKKYWRKMAIYVNM